MNEWEWQLLEDKNPVDRVQVNGADVKVGDRVRLRPRKGGDIMDLALAGQIGIVESVQQDYESKVHVCVVLDVDPGRDLGLLRQPGHRFFFDAEEIESLYAEDPQAAAVVHRLPSSTARILVAGIGNIFLGDDGFGVEVIRRLAVRALPAEVKIVDFGIRGFDLAYALQDGYETTILVDAYPHGQQPGTVSLVEPDLTHLNEAQQNMVDAHGMNPLNVLRMALAMKGSVKRVLLVGCEPATFGPEEGLMGLSAPVAAAVDEAVMMILATIKKILQESSKN